MRRVFDDQWLRRRRRHADPAAIRHPGHEISQRVWVEVGVGVHRHDERRLDRVEHAVEGVELARFGLEYAAIVEPQSRRRPPRPRSAVRSVELLSASTTCIRPGTSFRRAARASLRSPTPRSTPRRPPSRLATPRPATAPAAGHAQARDRAHDQGRCHEPDHQPRDVRQEQWDHPRHHRPDRLIKLIPPRPRRPNRERDPAPCQHDRNGEPDRRSHPRYRVLPPRKTANRTRVHDPPPSSPLASSRPSGRPPHMRAVAGRPPTHRPYSSARPSQSNPPSG